LKPNPGYEAEAEENFKILEDRLVKVDEDQMSVPQMARGLLLRPSIRSLLGISESMPLDSIPRWAMFQLLRLVYVVRVGETCRALGISSARLDFGTDLVGYSVFASTAGSEWTDELASYVVGAQLCDLGAVVEKSPSVLPAVVAFRDTQEGARLRADVLKNLAVPGGGDVEATINAGLQQSIPFADLHASRGRFEGLLIAQGNVAQKPPALWRSDRSSGNSVRRWRRRARSVLEEYIRKAGVKKQDDCPCGSHEPLKYCCLDALTE
jgi:hypothetical protein